MRRPGTEVGGWAFEFDNDGYPDTDDTAEVLLALRRRWPVGGATPPRAEDAIRRAVQWLVGMQSKDGGWGPYVVSAREPFDTAVVLLALSRLPAGNETREMMKRGRAYLIGAQKKDGSWPETTRPEGAESYAQRVSTTGWAAMALLATRHLVANPSDLK